MAPDPTEAAARPEGPFFFENWKRHVADPLLRTYEVALYTDAHITGEVRLGELGPYSLINTVPMSQTFGRLTPSVVLRYTEQEFDSASLTPMDRTDDERYHGGSLHDEFAALVSLCLGVRMWAGPITRIFEPNGDPLGRPRAGVAPALAVRRQGPLVAAFMHGGLLEAKKLAKAPSVAPEDARALVRAARLYQQAAWLADSEPHIAWLSLVSAVEAVADRWFKGDLDEEALLREHKPDLIHELQCERCSSATIAVVARAFGGTMKATAKFLNFLMEHMPDPPAQRPAEHAQLSWKRSDLKQALDTIYKYRSRALHDGRPFPYPMSEAPMNFKEWAAPEEIPSAVAAGTQGGQWLQRDTPMRFHIFEYIARNALLRWWESVPAGP